MSVLRGAFVPSLAVPHQEETPLDDVEEGLPFTLAPANLSAIRPSLCQDSAVSRLLSQMFSDHFHAAPFHMGPLPITPYDPPLG